MDRDPRALSPESAPAPQALRRAWLTAFAATIVLFAALGFARAAAAATLAVPTAPTAPGGPVLSTGVFAFDEEDEGEEEGEDGDEAEANSDCESDDQAAEEACEEKEEEREVAELRAEECRLDSAEATVSTLPGRGQVRLAIRYRAFEPSSVAVELRLRGSKGALDLGIATAPFGRSGTLHTAKTLSETEMARASAAREFTVGIHAVNTPRYCRDLFERHLTAHQQAGAGLLWSDPRAGRRSGSA